MGRQGSDKRKIVFIGGILVLGLAFVLTATLWPFNFNFHSLTWTQYIDHFFLAPSNSVDFPRNIVLFMPFGFGLALVFFHRCKSFVATLMFCLLSGFLLTLTVESLQIFLPGRSPSVSDLAANTIGSASGFGCAALWRKRLVLIQAILNAFTPFNCMLLSGAYLALLMCFVWWLMRGVEPGGWDPHYRLAVYNELTGDRPWRGRIHDLALMDRAVDRQEAERLVADELPQDVMGKALIAYYPLRGKAGMSDIMGNLPGLHWQSTHGECLTNEAWAKNQWLATEKAVEMVARRINGKKHFTIAMTVATADLKQDGPARIVTISHDPYLRNLTVAQVRDRLAVRWRSPLTGDNGISPEVQFAGVFKDFNPQRMVIGFNGGTIDFYSSNSPTCQSFALEPHLAFSALFHRDSYWPVTASHNAQWHFRLLLYVLVFFPLGLLLGAPSGLAGRDSIKSRMLKSGILLSPLGIAILAAAYQDHPLNPETVALGLAVIASTMLLAAKFTGALLNYIKQGGVKG